MRSTTVLAIAAAVAAPALVAAAPTFREFDGLLARAEHSAQPVQHHTQSVQHHAQPVQHKTKPVSNADALSKDAAEIARIENEITKDKGSLWHDEQRLIQDGRRPRDVFEEIVARTEQKKPVQAVHKKPLSTAQAVSYDAKAIAHAENELASDYRLLHADEQRLIKDGRKARSFFDELFARAAPNQQTTKPSAHVHSAVHAMPTAHAHAAVHAKPSTNAHAAVHAKPSAHAKPLSKAQAESNDAMAIAHAENELTDDYRQLQAAEQRLIKDGRRRREFEDIFARAPPTKQTAHPFSKAQAEAHDAKAIAYAEGQLAKDYRLLHADEQRLIKDGRKARSFFDELFARAAPNQQTAKPSTHVHSAVHAMPTAHAHAAVHAKPSTNAHAAVHAKPSAHAKPLSKAQAESNDAMAIAHAENELTDDYRQLQAAEQRLIKDGSRRREFEDIFARALSKAQAEAHDAQAIAHAEGQLAKDYRLLHADEQRLIKVGRRSRDFGDIFARAAPNKQAVRPISTAQAISNDAKAIAHAENEIAKEQHALHVDEQRLIKDGSHPRDFDEFFARSYDDLFARSVFDELD